MKKVFSLIALFAAVVAAEPFSLPAGNTAHQYLELEFSGDGSAALAGFPEKIYGFDLTASITLPEEHGFARVVLVGEDGSEHLVLEAYPLLGYSGRTRVEGFCEETCY